jgi:hypothetical protein
LPRYIVQELRAYLECGILAYGFVRVRCSACGESRLVAFSCKKRGFCPSCLGRRMADTAAHLVDHVLPHAPVRQWVLSLPYELRYRLAWDGPLLGAVLAVFQRAVAGWYRAQTRRQGHAAGRCGAVTFVQRFGSSLNLNPHLHMLMPDGVWVSGPGGVHTFVAADPPTEADIQRLVERTAQRLVRLLQRRGLLDQDRTDPLAQDQPLLAALTAAAVQGIVATGPRAGQRLRRRLTDPPGGQRTAPLCYAARGFSLHAATRVAAPDRGRLEQLCRYVLRPPLAAARLRWLAPDTLSLTLKTPWADGPPPPAALPSRTAGETGRSGAPAAATPDPLPRGPRAPRRRPRPDRPRPRPPGGHPLHHHRHRTGPAAGPGPACSYGSSAST